MHFEIINAGTSRQFQETLLEVAFWSSKESFDAGDPPQVTESFNVDFRTHYRKALRDENGNLRLQDGGAISEADWKAELQSAADNYRQMRNAAIAAGDRAAVRSLKTQARREMASRQFVMGDVATVVDADIYAYLSKWWDRRGHKLTGDRRSKREVITNADPHGVWASEGGQRVRSHVKPGIRTRVERQMRGGR